MFGGEKMLFEKSLKGRYWVRTTNGYVIATTDSREKAKEIVQAFFIITGRRAYIYDTY